MHRKLQQVINYKSFFSTILCDILKDEPRIVFYRAIYIKNIYDDLQRTYTTIKFGSSTVYLAPVLMHTGAKDKQEPEKKNWVLAPVF